MSSDDPYADLPSVPPPTAQFNDDPYAGLVHKPAPPPPSALASLSDPAAWKRGAQLTGRSLIEGVTALPLLATDVGVGARNLFGQATGIGGTNYELPSSVFARGLDELGFPRAQTPAEKMASLGDALVGGALAPGGVAGAAERAPANFMSPEQTKLALTAQTLRQAQDKGLVVPPATTNPTIPNVVLESIAGKNATQQGAQAINQAARNRIAVQALGLSPDTPLTAATIDAIKKETGPAYEAARAIPRFQTSDDYINALSGVSKDAETAKALTGPVGPDISKAVDNALQPSMSGDEAVSAIKVLRDKASDAFGRGDSSAGRAYKQISKAIEDELERGAGSMGGQYSDLVGNLRNARTRYAVASTIGDSMDAAGNVLGPKLAANLRNGGYMTGDLRTAAEHAVNFGKANLAPNSSPVSHLDSWAAMMAGMELPGWWKLAGVAWPASRMASKGYLLSDMGQASRGIPAQESIDASVPAREALSRAMAAALMSQQSK